MLFTFFLFICRLQDTQNSNDQMSLESQQIPQIHVQIPDYVPYSNYKMHKLAHDDFKKKFTDNIFGYSCSVCDRLWFKDDLKKPTDQHENILRNILVYMSLSFL